MIDALGRKGKEGLPKSPVWVLIRHTGSVCGLDDGAYVANRDEEIEVWQSYCFAKPQDQGGYRYRLFEAEPYKGREYKGRKIDVPLGWIEYDGFIWRKENKPTSISGASSIGVLVSKVSPLEDFEMPTLKLTGEQKRWCKAQHLGDAMREYWEAHGEPSKAEISDMVGGRIGYFQSLMERARQTLGAMVLVQMKKERLEYGEPGSEDFLATCDALTRREREIRAEILADESTDTVMEIGDDDLPLLASRL